MTVDDAVSDPLVSPTVPGVGLRPVGSGVRSEVVRSLLAEAVLDALDSQVAVLGADGTVLAVNEAWDRLVALNGSPWVAVGADYLGAATRCEPLEGPSPPDLVASMLAGDRARGICEYALGAGDERVYFQMIATAHETDGQRFIVTRHAPVTDQHRSRSAIEFRSQLLDQVDVAVVATDLRGTIITWNAGATSVFGWRAEEAIGCDAIALLVPAGREGQARLITEHTRLAGTWEGQVDLCDRDGRQRAVEARYRVLDGGDGPTGLVLVAVDASERLEMERRVVRANARLRAVTERMGEGLATLDAQGRITYVNPHGQQLLGGQRVRTVGGSFVNRLIGLDADGEARSLEDHLIGHEFPGRLPSEPTEELLLRPDGSLLPIEYVASRLPADDGSSDGWVVVFRDISARRERDAELERQAEHAHWMGIIDDALTNDLLVLHAQPLLDLQTREVVSHELLLRIDHPHHGLIAPGRFLPSAERFGMVPVIDRWVIGQGIELAAEGLCVEINVSARSLTDPTIAELIATTLARTGCEASRVGFELTETAMLENDRDARRFAEQVRALGCRLALDDFGTGYGGLAYLKQLPVDTLKIDREFVKDALVDPASRRVITAVVGLADAFELLTVAEGVEDEDTARLLDELGVTLAQGYLFGRPGPIDLSRVGDCPEVVAPAPHG